MSRYRIAFALILGLAVLTPCLALSQTTTTTGTTTGVSRTGTTSSSSSNSTTNRLEGYKASVDEYAIRVTVRSMLETYAKNHPNTQVRIWSLIVLSKFGSNMGTTTSGTTTSGTTTSSSRTSNNSSSSSSDDVGNFEFYLSLPTLFQMLDDREEAVRLIASQTLQSSLDLSEEEWQRFMAPILINLAKTAKYPNVRVLCIKFIPKLSKMTLTEINSLPLMLDLAQNEDKDVRQAAIEGLEAQLKEFEAPKQQEIPAYEQPIPGPFPTP